MFTLWIMASLIGLFCVIALAVWGSIVSLQKHNAKRKQVKDQLLSVAQQFDGHLVERGWNGMPKLVLNHAGRRFRVSFRPHHINEASQGTCGTGSSYGAVNACGAQDCSYLHIIAECTNPEFRMSVEANSFASRVNAFFGKGRCQTGDADFDQKFLVFANRHHDSIEMILNRNVRHELLVGSAFYLRAKNTKPQKFVAKKTNGDESARRRVRSRYHVPIGAVSMLNKGRISLFVEGGQIEAKLLVHEAEYARLGEILLSVMQAVGEINRSLALLNKNQKHLEEV